MIAPTGPCPAKIMIVGEAPGAEEERQGRPFVGPSGHLLDSLLHEAGILRSECFVTNVVRVRPPNNEISYFISRKKRGPDGWTQVGDLWLHPKALEGYNLLLKEIQLCNPKVIIALGNLALWALSSKWGITDWRGSQLKCSSLSTAWVIPTYHPAAVLRQWSWRPYVTLDLKRARSCITEGVVEPQYRMILGPQINEAASTLSILLERLDEAPLQLAVDIETRYGHIDCLGIAWSPLDAICIPFLRFGSGEGYWTLDEEVEIVWLLRRVLTHPNALIVGQNFSYDMQYISRSFGFEPRLALDTMITHHVCWPGTDKGLDVLSSLYCKFHRFWKHDSKDASEEQNDLKRWAYNAEDCLRTYEIVGVLVDAVHKLGLRDQCIFQHQMLWHAFDTMQLGVRMDAQEKNALAATLSVESEKRKAWLQSIVGHPLNPKSPLQMRLFFYEDLKLKPVLDRKTGNPTTAGDALETLARREPLIKPLVKAILEIRSLEVFRSTFVESRLDHDGRMRCSYNVAGTETFRFSSSENAFGSGMNLQNIPKGGALEDDPDALVLPNIRKLFIPDEGYELFDMDLSSADLRIVVWEADEREMKAMFHKGLDPYTEIAKEFYHDPSITKRDPRRQLFKSFVHGTNYLGTARGLAVRLGLPVAQAEATQRWYFSKFPRIAIWQDNLRKRLQSTRTVQNCWGYRRFFFDRVEGTVYNQAAAWIPQSTIGILINKIWDRIRREEPEVRILLQVHDSLVGEYPRDRADYFRQRLQDLSRVVLPYSDPLIIPTGFKYSTKSWGDCEEPKEALSGKDSG